MSLVAISFVACFMLAAVAGWAAVSSAGRLSRKIAALVALALLVPAGYGSISELLGRPKPASSAWLEDFTTYHTVIAWDIHEDKAIYLWLEMPDGQEPRVFAFPYDTATVSRLQKAGERAKSLASKLLARLEETGPAGTSRLEFTSQTEFRRELPAKPDPDDEDVFQFDGKSET